MMKTQVMTSVVLLVSLLGGCRVMETPKGFVALSSDYDQDFYAVAANGNTLVVKTHVNPDDGTLEFWKSAIVRELIETRGYSLTKEQGITTKAGLRGSELLMTSTPSTGSYTYAIWLFVEGDRVVVVEAGGQNEAMEADLPALRTAVKTLD